MPLGPIPGPVPAADPKIFELVGPAIDLVALERVHRDKRLALTFREATDGQDRRSGYVDLDGDPYALVTLLIRLARKGMAAEAGRALQDARR